MSRTTSKADGGGIAADLRTWARGSHSTEATVELLIRASGGRFVEPGQPWLSTDDRGITWLDAQIVRQYAHAVSRESATFWRLSRPWHLAGRSKMSAVSWPAWTPTISISSSRPCGIPAVAARLGGV